MPNVKRKSSSGFTLIELLVVILVIGALSGVLLGVVNNSGVRGKARDSQRKADLKKIQVALELYFAENRAYPSSGSNWQVVNGTSGAIQTLVPDYINPIPVDPSMGTSPPDNPCNNPDSNRYNYLSAGPSYYLTAIMEVPTSSEDSPCSDHTSALNCGALNTSEVCYLVRNP